LEKIIEVNENWLFSEDHYVLTKRGLLKAKELQYGDKVIWINGESTINNIIYCKKRPDATIVSKTDAMGN